MYNILTSFSSCPPTAAGESHGETDKYFWCLRTFDSVCWVGELSAACSLYPTEKKIPEEI